MTDSTTPDSSIVPTFDAYIEPTVAVLRSATGAMGNDEINRAVAASRY